MVFENILDVHLKTLGAEKLLLYFIISCFCTFIYQIQFPRRQQKVLSAVLYFVIIMNGFLDMSLSFWLLLLWQLVRCGILMAHFFYFVQEHPIEMYLRQELAAKVIVLAAEYVLWSYGNSFEYQLLHCLRAVIVTSLILYTAIRKGLFEPVPINYLLVIYMVLCGANGTVYFEEARTPVKEGIAGLILLVAFFSVMIFFCFRYYVRKERQIQEQMRRLLQTRYSYFRGMGEVRQRLEEMTEHVSDALNSENAERVIKDTMEQCGELTGTNLTGKPTLDAILFLKQRQCRELDIQLNLEICYPEWGCLTEMELVSLIGNLTDNAIEACRKIEGAERRIDIRMKPVRNYLLLNVCNSKPEYQLPVAERFQTTKADRKHHGFGMEIIREIVARYEGEISFRDYRDRFCTEIGMKIK